MVTMKQLAGSLLVCLHAAVAAAAPPNVLYVSHAIQNRVSVVDRSTGNIMASIPLPGGPGAFIAWGVHGDRNAKRVYVARNASTGGGGDVVIIDGLTNSVLSTVSLAPNATYSPAVERSGRYVNLLTDDGIRQYDGSNMNLVDVMPEVGFHTSFGIHRAVRYLFTVNKSAQQLKVVRERPLTLLGSTQLPCVPDAVSVNPRGLFHSAVACSTANKVVEVRNAVVTAEHFANNPSDLAFGPTNKFLWVAEKAGAGVRRINVRNGETVTIPLGASVWAVAAVGGRLFAVGHDRLWILDEESGVVVADRALNGGSAPITGNGLFLPCSKGCGSVR